MSKTLGIIGSGRIGSTVARLALAAGLNVVLSNSRGPGTLAGIVAELGERVRAATPAEAAQAGDLVVVSIPLHAYEQLPAAALAGKTVVDATNYNLERDGHIPELDSGELTSSALIQRHLTGSRVVKAFNTILYTHLLALARPAGAHDRSALPIAGDDPAAKAELNWLLDLLGYDTVDIGSLADSWRSDPGTPVYVRPYLQEIPQGMSQEEAMRWIFETPGVPAPADCIKDLVDAAVRVRASEVFTNLFGG